MTRSREHSNAQDAACQAAVVLVRPREEGNVGAVARAMANMGLVELVLVEPAPALQGVARGFGVGGWHVLDGARRAGSLAEAVAAFRRVVGTTAVRGRNLGRQRLVTPRELAAELRAGPPGTPTALVFGPEDVGLAREELAFCDPIVRVPAAAAHPTLNLAQAVLLVAYELFVTAGDPMEAPPSAGDLGPLATAEESAGLLAAVGEVFSQAGFDQGHIHASLLRDARRLLARSGASSHETRVLWRVANRILQRLGGRC